MDATVTLSALPIDPGEAVDPPAAELRVATSHQAVPGLTGPVHDMLRLIREDLQMDVVFVAEFVDGRRVFRQIEQGPGVDVIEAGQSHTLEESLCQRVVDGRLPPLVHDVSALVASHGLPAYTAALGAHIAAPVRLRDGRIYGTLCCFSFAPNSELGERDLKRLEMAAQIIARLLDEAQGHDSAPP